MLSKRENFLATIKGGKPDRLVKQYEAINLLLGDPINRFINGPKRYPGMEPTYDGWGTKIIWPAGEPGSIPDPKVRVLEDVTCWRDFVKVPDIIANCSDPELWEPYLEQVSKADRDERLLTVFAPTGIFERMHYLMGFEDTLCNFMLEEEAMEDLSMAIGEHRYQYVKLMCEMVHPDAVFFHDDWGSKQNLFVQPELWRKILKPAIAKGYDYVHDQGVLVIHHADSYCEPIVQDMIDMHVDLWQGVLPQNDILKIQQQFGGQIALMGGIDAAVVDREDSTEEEIRAEVRRVCMTYAKNGYFVPCITYGDPYGTLHPHANDIINDEIDRCSSEIFG